MYSGDVNILDLLKIDTLHLFILSLLTLGKQIKNKMSRLKN